MLVSIVLNTPVVKGDTLNKEVLILISLLKLVMIFYSILITDLASLIEQGRKAAVRYVNTALVATYWFIGRRIVEYEQKGKERAEYGEALLKKISIDLTPRFGK